LAGTERASARAADQDRADRLVMIQGREAFDQFIAHTGVHSIEHARAIELHMCDRVIAIQLQELGHRRLAFLNRPGHSGASRY
jgi:hypothetical protein